LLDVGDAAVAEFQGISVKCFPQFVACRKRFIEETEERSSSVGFDVLVVWWVEPYNISSSFAFLCRWFLFLIAGRCFFV